MGTSPTFGLCYDFRQKMPFTQQYESFYAQCLEEINEGERLGVESVWLCEHHFTADGFLPSPLIVAAAIAVHTHRMRIGTNILILPLHHPLRIAEDAAVVALLSGGRFTLAVGQGYAPDEFETFGVDRHQRASLFEEGVQIIRQAWQEGHIGYEGKHWHFDDLPFGPRPTDPIPIYFGAVSEKAIDRAVRYADGLLVYISEKDHIAPRYRLMKEALKRHGRAEEDFAFCVSSVVYVHEDGEQAWAQAAPALAYLEKSIAAYSRDQPELVRPEHLARENYLIGTPQQVAEGLYQLHRAVPYDHFCFWGHLPGLTHQQALANIRLVATQVIPALRDLQGHA